MWCTATVVEVLLDRSRGTLLRVIVNCGEIRPREIFACGSLSGRVINVLDDQRLSLEGPAVPGQAVEVS